jgi:hypothetical protein
LRKALTGLREASRTFAARRTEQFTQDLNSRGFVKNAQASSGKDCSAFLSLL